MFDYYYLTTATIFTLIYIIGCIVYFIYSDEFKNTSELDILFYIVGGSIAVYIFAPIVVPIFTIATLFIACNNLIEGKGFNLDKVTQ